MACSLVPIKSCHGLPLRVYSVVMQLLVSEPFFAVTKFFKCKNNQRSLFIIISDRHCVAELN